MALDIWFPLAIYYEDMAGAADHNPALLARIQALRASTEVVRTSSNSSWTGDVHDVDRLHLDPAFDWLTDQVGEHALRYLKSLGHDLSIIDVHIQRSWPVIGGRDQRVARHAHHTAHLSAVYYVSAAELGDPGQLRFLNDARPNELSPGIGSNNTNGYAQPNVFNYDSAVYKPLPGRLLLFPAKQTHAVDSNDTDEERVSISYDMVITSRGTQEQGHHEFLMPSPSVWRRVSRSEAEMVVGPRSVPHLPNGRTALADMSTRFEARDGFVLPERDGHILWKSVLLGDCASAASWQACEAAVAEQPPQDWLRDHSGTVMLWSGAGAWPVFGEAVERLHLHLRDHDVPLEGASIGQPVLQRRAEPALQPFQRGKGHLLAYLRLDRDIAEPCELQFAEGGSVALPPGGLLLAGGARRQRLAGTSHVLAFEVDLPAIARPDALALRGLHDPEAPDSVVFAALTAQPLAMALPAGPMLRDKLEWLDRRARLRHRQRDCPATARYILDQADPAEATQEELLLIRGHGRGAGDAGQLAVREGVLNSEQCAALRGYLETHMNSVVPDSVDGRPEYQVNLTRAQLHALVGDGGLATLMDLPCALGAAAGGGGGRLAIFLRKYSADTRPYITFHSDTSAFTANIALSDDDDVTGGRLLALHEGRLEHVRRAVGTALIHAGDLVHGVSRIERGIRYSLILFFLDQPAQAEAA